MIAGQQEGPLDVRGHALKERPPLWLCVFLQSSTAGARWHREGRELMGPKLEFLPGSQVFGVKLEQHHPLSWTSWDYSDSIVA